MKFFVEPTFKLLRYSQCIPVDMSANAFTDDIGKSGVGCGLRIGTTNILEDDSSTVDLGSSPAVDSNARTGSRKGQLQPSGADEEDTFEEPSSGDENDESSAGRKLKGRSLLFFVTISQCFFK